MNAPTDDQRDDEFGKRMKREGDLGMMLSQHVWDKYDLLRLGGEEFEVVGCDGVPGYEDEEYGVFLRRKPDGQVFEAEIDVTIQPVLTPEQLAERAQHAKELAGQMKLPVVQS